MSAFPFAMIGFDLDGTLVDSNRDIMPAINHALSQADRPALSVEESRKAIGGGAQMMLEKALEQTGGPVPQGQFDTLQQIMLDHYEAHIADNTVPFDGCLDALDALAEHGCALAVITNKIERNARILLEKLGMAERFACVLGGDTLGRDRAKPAPDMIHDAIRQCGRRGRFAMIGDSSFDTRAARAAGVPVIALSFGYTDIPAHELDCDALIDHYDELLPALKAVAQNAS